MIDVFKKYEDQPLDKNEFIRLKCLEYAMMFAQARLGYSAEDLIKLADYFKTFVDTGRNPYKY